jgi:hypothetical protein
MLCSSSRCPASCSRCCCSEGEPPMKRFARRSRARALRLLVRRALVPWQAFAWSASAFTPTANAA